MTDLEITKLCAEAMGYEVIRWEHGWSFPNGPEWNPLNEDAQAMALVKRFNLRLYKQLDEWDVGQALPHLTPLKYRVRNADLNRAICECVAKMQSEKVSA